jgi:hypothetical protein
VADKLCLCGSGLRSQWQYDARGIALCRTCPLCHQRQMGKYRAEVLTDPNYEADEQISEE